MDGSQKKKSLDAIVAAINIGAGIGAAIIPANKSRAAGANEDRIEKIMHPEVSILAIETTYKVKGVLVAKGRSLTSGNLN